MNELFPEPKQEFDAGNNKKYKIKSLEIVPFMPKKQKNFYQVYTIWFLEKAI